MKLIKRIEDFFLKRPLRIYEKEVHRNIMKRGFLTAFLYSFLYGIYEYFIVYHYPRLLDLLGPTLNWTIMYLGVVLCVAITTRYKGKFTIEQIVMGLFFMTMFEDVMYWMSQWIDTGVYPFPAGNWWDSTLASFRVLGGLGQPIPIWPYVPFYYLPGFSMVIIFYFISFHSPKYSRIAGWVIGPFFIAIIAGTLTTDLFAFYSLLLIPIGSYIYIGTLYIIQKLASCI
ncbi:MAG: hypothetical protein R6U96_01090 [Promethearchaeia archaeon]